MRPGLVVARAVLRDAAWPVARYPAPLKAGRQADQWADLDDLESLSQAAERLALESAPVAKVTGAVHPAV